MQRIKSCGISYLCSDAAVKEYPRPFSNWLGDMVMAVPFLKALQDAFPGYCIDLILKKELGSIAAHLPATGETYLFSKKEHRGLFGAASFGRGIRRKKKYDLFFCLPDSLSAAIMAKATGAETRIGFKKSINIFFFSKSIRRTKNVHRTEEYIQLLANFLQKEIAVPSPNWCRYRPQKLMRL